MDKKLLASELLELIEEEKAKPTHTKSKMDEDFSNAAGGRFKIEGVSRETIRELAALFDFLNRHPEIENDFLGEILRNKLVAFRGLREFYRVLPNFSEVLRSSGVLSTAKCFSNTVLMTAVK